jgi:hypothetical protein
MPDTDGIINGLVTACPDGYRGTRLLRRLTHTKFIPPGRKCLFRACAETIIGLSKYSYKNRW